MAGKTTNTRKNRRALLTAAVAASAAAAGARLVGGSTASAGDVIKGNPLLGGVVNTVHFDGTKTSGATTYVASNVPNFSAFNVINLGGAGALSPQVSRRQANRSGWLRERVAVARRRSFRERWWGFALAASTTAYWPTPPAPKPSRSSG